MEEIALALHEIAKLAELLVSLRETGFTDRAVFYPRSYPAMAMLCAWNNVPIDKAPKGWWFFPSEADKKAWERIAAAAPYKPVSLGGYWEISGSGALKGGGKVARKWIQTKE